MQNTENSVRRDTKDLKREKTNHLSEYSELIAALGPPPNDELWLITAVTTRQLTFNKVCDKI